MPTDLQTQHAIGRRGIQLDLILVTSQRIDGIAFGHVRPVLLLLAGNAQRGTGCNRRRCPAAAAHAHRVLTPIASPQRLLLDTGQTGMLAMSVDPGPLCLLGQRCPLGLLPFPCTPERFFAHRVAAARSRLWPAAAGLGR